MLNRRDFLKLLLLLPLAANKQIGKISSNKELFSSPDNNQPNIFIFLFDTLSARHISLYGYPRDTMPNLAKFAEKANVYHQHHAGGNWTPPGTASLFTGSYPWSHRCISLYSQVVDQYADKNIFSITNGHLNTLAYSQNNLVETQFRQFENDIDVQIPWLSGIEYNFRPEKYNFENDFIYSHWAANLIQGTNRFPATSPFFSVLYEIYFTFKYNQLSNKHREKYPMGLPFVLPGVLLLPDEISAFVEEHLVDSVLPTLSYYHFLPPHSPYHPQKKFIELFDDDWFPIEKPTHIFSDGSSQTELDYNRLSYDQFIANVDSEIGEIITNLEQSGKLDNSYLIFTSDHGESFERGIWRHLTRVLYEPLIHIPLLIHKPGQMVREDYYSPTSAVDILPTICQITGQPIPEWTEGETLPGFRNTPPDPQRPIFSVEAKENSKFGPLTIATISMIQWPYKLIHYFGYEELPYHFELYNLEEDQEELEDLYPQSLAVANQMREKLLTKLDEVNLPFL